MSLPQYVLKMCDHAHEDMGIKNPECRGIGGGHFGYAYSIGDNKVLKITESQREFDSINDHIVGKDIDGLVKYYKTYNVGEVVGVPRLHHKYGIVMDYAQPLNTRDRSKFLKSWMKTIRFFHGENSAIYHHKQTIMQDIRNHIKKHGSLIHSPLWVHLVKTYSGDYGKTDATYKAHEYLKLFTLFVKTSIKLIEQGIIHEDSHDKNVGWDPYGNFVFFDYG
jgi:hypothetical protein